MLFKPKDWSDLSYNEVKNQLEQYRSNYTLKDKDLGTSNEKTIDETK